MKTTLLQFVILISLISLSSTSVLARCSDYSSAAEIIRAYKNGETDLDRDNDCYACESTFNAYVCGPDTNSKVQNPKPQKQTKAKYKKTE